MGGPGSTSDERDVTLGPGTRLGKYEVVRLLGAGGMGAVYEASHTEIGKRVAIKVLSPAIAAVPGARARFLREAQLTSRVRHPNIVDVTDMGSDAGQTYLVMEFLSGEDLAQRLTRTGPIPAWELADIMLPVCSAVVAAHQAGVTHRDLKPQNIFLASGPHVIQPKVLDFGISKGDDLVNTGSLTGTGAMIGTPFYLAPEQIMDTRSAGPPSDQYALGVILYECLTGHRPFDADNLFMVLQAIVAGSAPRPRERRPDLDIPPQLEDIVVKTMSLDPRARFISTQELGRELLPFASARTRSIWEGAFGISGGVAVPAGASSGPPDAAASRTPPLRASTPQPGPGARAAHTPTTIPQWGTPGPTVPAPSARAATPLPPADAAPVKRKKTAKTVPLPDSAEADRDDADGFQGVSRSRGLMWLGIAGGVAAGLIVALLAFRTSPETPQSPQSPRTPRATEARSGGASTAGVPEDRRSPSSTTAAASTTAAGPTTAVGPTTAAASTITAAPTTAAASTAAAASGSPPASASAPAPSPRGTARDQGTYKVSVSVVPEIAAIELDGMSVGRGHIERTLPVDHAAHTLRLSADGFEPQTIEFTDAAPPQHVALRHRARSEPAPRAVTPAPPRPARRPHPGEPANNTLNPNGAPVID